MTSARPQSNVMSSDELLRPRKRPRKQPTGNPVYLACPFLKNNPQHRKCRHHQLTKISCVKEHIQRVYKTPPHCRRCNKVFQTEDQLHEHVRSTICELRSYTPPGGVTEKQIFQLQNSVDPKKSPEDQWYEVFDTIFPEGQRPMSVYLNSDSQDLDGFFNFLMADGRELFLAA